MEARAISADRLVEEVERGMRFDDSVEAAEDEAALEETDNTAAVVAIALWLACA